MNQITAKNQYSISFEINWSKCVSTRQTLFAKEKNDEGELFPFQGIPKQNVNLNI